eukprot:GHVU01102265.1.p1 GENE.GHVU01102265.1~~GHVU01102265.1.p1  ORF type:complete len:736 (+),score=129.37 GHVU01102265.1:280-2208(+)
MEDTEGRSADASPDGEETVEIKLEEESEGEEKRTTSEEQEGHVAEMSLVMYAGQGARPLELPLPRNPQLSSGGLQPGRDAMEVDGDNEIERTPEPADAGGLVVESGHDNQAEAASAASHVPLDPRRVNLDCTPYVLTIKCTWLQGMNTGNECVICIEPAGSLPQRTARLPNRNTGMLGDTTLRFGRCGNEAAGIAIRIEDENADAWVLGSGTSVVPTLGAGICKYIVQLQGPGKNRAAMVFCMTVLARLDVAVSSGGDRLPYSCDEGPVTVCALPMIDLALESSEEEGEASSQGGSTERESHGMLVDGYDSSVGEADAEEGVHRGMEAEGGNPSASAGDGCKPATELRGAREDEDNSGKGGGSAGGKVPVVASGHSTTANGGTAQGATGQMVGTPQVGAREHQRQAGEHPTRRWMEGDYVLVACSSHKRGQNIAVRWRGPYRITNTRSEGICEVQDLNNKRRIRAHTRRIKYYCEHKRDVEEELAALAKDQQELWQAKRIESFVHNPETQDWEVEISGQDEEDENERMFDLLAAIAIDIPVRALQAFCTKRRNHPDGLEEALRQWIPGKRWAAQATNGARKRQVKRRKAYRQAARMKEEAEGNVEREVARAGRTVPDPHIDPMDRSGDFAPGTRAQERRHSD